MNPLLHPLRGLACAAAMGLLAHAPVSFAAYAGGSADAALVVTAGAGYQLLDSAVTPSASTATVGDALADADGTALLLPDGLFVSGAATADALFPPASAASASYSSVQPLYVLNTSGAANTVDFSFDWSFVLGALDDFIAPVEQAGSVVTVKLQQLVNGVATELFAASAFADIGSGAASDAGSFSFSYTLAPGEQTSFLVGINASAQALTAVPLPASVLLLAPALGMLAIRRRPG